MSKLIKLKNSIGKNLFCSDLLLPFTTFFLLVLSCTPNKVNAQAGLVPPYQGAYFAQNENITIQTASVTNLSKQAATCGGSFTATQGTVIERGIIYSTSPSNLTIALGTKIVSGSGGTSSFSETMTGLTTGTTYYVLAYAKTSKTTYYGTYTSFVPTMQTYNAPVGNTTDWAIPPGVTSITLTVKGATGGAVRDYNGLGFKANGGDGASITATFTVVPSEILKLSVGTTGGFSTVDLKGTNNVYVAHLGGGGGGSFVWSSSRNDFYIVSGGGGGGALILGQAAPGALPFTYTFNDIWKGKNASLGTSGGSAQNITPNGSYLPTGGVGSVGNSPPSYSVAAGGGAYQDIQGTAYDAFRTNGRSYFNNSGNYYPSGGGYYDMSKMIGVSAGGFGGGAGPLYSNGLLVAGAGGGYSGGAGGTFNGWSGNTTFQYAVLGGGGGSYYLTSLATSVSSGSNSGENINGSITINY